MFVLSCLSLVGCNSIPQGGVGGDPEPSRGGGGIPELSRFEGRYYSDVTSCHYEVIADNASQAVDFEWSGEVVISENSIPMLDGIEVRPGQSFTSPDGESVLTVRSVTPGGNGVVVEYEVRGESADLGITITETASDVITFASEDVLRRALEMTVQNDDGALHMTMACDGTFSR